MSNFNIHDNKINNQYVAGENINFSSVQNSTQLIEKLENFKLELSKSLHDKLISDEVYTDSDRQITEAIQQSNKSVPDKKNIMEHLNNAKSLLKDVSAVGGLITTLNEAIKVVSKFF